MSIPWDQSRSHPLNHSLSKSTYAFPKSPRFMTTRRPLCDTFYNITKSLKTEKGAGIGKGIKYSFGDKYGFPSPQQYQIHSVFNDSKKVGRGFSIGVGREKLKYGGIFDKSETPDPARYNPKDSRVKTPPGYSMRSRVKQQCPSYKKNPGPGQYQIQSTINKTGIYTLSNLSNCKCPKIKLSKDYDPTKNDKVPGPGSYALQKENLNGNGKYFISKYSNSRCRTFSKSSHQIVGKNDLPVPGPGNYNHYSEFGARGKLI